MDHIAEQALIEVSRIQRGAGVFVCLTWGYARPLGPRHIVLVNGEYYDVSKFVLAALRNGETPEELGLEPCEYPADEGGRVRCRFGWKTRSCGRQ